MSTQTNTKSKSGKLKSYLKGVKAEYRKVVWPTKKELLNYTVVVISLSAITALIVWGMDLGLRKILSFIIK